MASNHQYWRTSQKGICIPKWQKALFVPLLLLHFQKSEDLLRERQENSSGKTMASARIYQNNLRIGIILFRLTHFLPIFCKNNAVDDNVLKCRRIVQRIRQYVKRIKPSTSLVEPFRNKIGRKTFFQRNIFFPLGLPQKCYHLPKIPFVSTFLIKEMALKFALRTIL